MANPGYAFHRQPPSRMHYTMSNMDVIKTRLIMAIARRLFFQEAQVVHQLQLDLQATDLHEHS